MKQWVTTRCRADLSKVAARYNISETFAEVLVKRGLYDWASMDGYLFDDMVSIPKASEMLGLCEAADLIEQKLSQGKKMHIVGDYDVDGVMSTYILCHGLRSLGGDVSFRLPHRQKDGYGIRDYMVTEAKEQGVDTIITCDNGISAGQPIQTAKELGMTVVLTDHHEVPMKDGEELLPSADVIVDPKQSVDNYPYPQLCGAGIAYKLIYELYHRAGKKGCDRELLPFAAMATVCDVVPLYGENRSIVRRGLAGIHQTGNIGLNALIKHLDFHKEIRAMDLGFRIGPCINAPGRLRDATESLELFMETDAECAAQRAARIVETNEERKERTRSMTKQAAEEVQKQPLPPVLVVYLQECHESVAGIVAGNLREQFYRPVYVITDSGDHLKGSGRSIPGYHMQQELQACQKYLTEFGGHAAAAGFSLRRAQLEGLKSALLAHCSLTQEQLIEKVTYDREVALAEMDTTLVTQLSWMEPTGEQNAPAVFAKRDAQIAQIRMCGADMHIAQVRFVENGKIYQAVDFSGEECIGNAVRDRYGEQVWERLKQGERGEYTVDILFSVSINERYGSLQLQLIDCQ